MQFGTSWEELNTKENVTCKYFRTIFKTPFNFAKYYYVAARPPYVDTGKRPTFQ